MGAACLSFLLAQSTPGWGPVRRTLGKGHLTLSFKLQESLVLCWLQAARDPGSLRCIASLWEFMSHVGQKLLPGATTKYNLGSNRAL